VSAESWEPTWFLRHFEALLPPFASGRFAFLGVPIQSGSARVIAQMGRTYDPADVVAAVLRLRAAAPGLVVRTDLLYGYGDETDADFAASLDASRAFDLPSFNAYQPRPGTPPLELPAAVLQARRDEGFAELHRRAQAGVARVRRWGQAAAPVEPPPAAAPPAPWDEPAGRAWLTRTAARFAALTARRVPLGDTRWALVGARAGRDAVELLLHGPSGATQVVGLRDPAWPGPYFGTTARFGLQVRASSLAAGSDAQDRVLAALLGALGG